MRILGPEFHRNLWIRLSPTALIAMPLLLGLLLLIAYLTSHTGTELNSIYTSNYAPLYTAKPHWSSWLVSVSLIIYFLVAGVWGTIEAAAAFTGENKDKTWDLQKISSIRPRHLIIGKLFGTTSYTWYFSLGALAIFIWSYSLTFEDLTEGTLTQATIGPIKPNLHYPSLQEVLTVTFFLIFAVLSAHAVALWTSLNQLMRGSSSSIGGMILGLVTLWPLGHHAVGLMSRSYFELVSSENMEWYGIEISVINFTLLSCLYALFWVIVSTYRGIRKELNFKNYPFVLLAFFISLCLYITGFETIVPLNSNDPKIFTCFALMFPITYLLLFKNSHDLDGYRRFFRSFRTWDLKRALENTPEWMVAAVVLLPLAAYAIFALWDLPRFATLSTGLVVLSLLFMTRDAMIMHIVFLGDRVKRAGLSIAVYYILVYALLPILAVQIYTAASDASMNRPDVTLKFILATFSPLIADGDRSNATNIGWAAIMPITIQLFIVSSWFSRTLKKLKNPEQKQ